jgi:hypothetical protein
MHYKSKQNITHKKFRNELCKDNMSVGECELVLLRQAIDETELLKGQNIINNEEIKHIIEIVEIFLVKKKLICYGGTAVNNILPPNAQFYNKDTEIPDYDFYSPNALDDEKELADMYFAEGYTEVEAKSGVHYGTYKVFVNFIPIADITELNKNIYKSISKDAINIKGINYAPPNFLRMNMYLELSRPAGDISRWEKVLKRLNLLNEHYPILTNNTICKKIDFQRPADINMEDNERLHIIVRDTLVNQEVVFFGGYATSLYYKYNSSDETREILKVPDFDVLCEDINLCADVLKKELTQSKFKKIKIIHHEGIHEILPEHIEIKVDGNSIVNIYKPIACHSYNSINIAGKNILVATIDTILTFYLAFIYSKDNKYDNKRLLCIADFLFTIEQKNRVENKGLLKRFSINCYGKQLTLQDIRAEKALKYKELIKNKNGVEYQKWFLKYMPGYKLSVSKKLSYMLKYPKTRKNKIVYKEDENNKVNEDIKSKEISNDYLY